MLIFFTYSLLYSHALILQMAVMFMSPSNAHKQLFDEGIRHLFRDVETEA